MRPQRVALFSEYYLPHLGGIELHVQALARALQRSAVEVTVVTPYRGAAEWNGVPVMRLALPLLPVWRTVFTPAGILPIDDLFRSGRFDLVHCHHSVYSPATACVAYLAQRAGLPTVVSFHSLLNGYASAFAALDSVTGWSRWPAAFCAVSDRVARGLQPLLGRRPVHVLPNGIEPSAWQCPPASPSSEFRVVSTMRLVRRKRPRALIEMLAHLRERLPDGLRLRARIIGGGTERPAVERLIAERRLGSEVELCGRLPPERIREAYGDADVFVLPSLEESFGLAALEARAAGLPLVVMGGSGPADFIEHGRSGLVARSDAHMTAALVTLARDPEMRARMAAHNRRVPPPFGWDEVVGRHLAVYENATREASCSSG